MTPANESNTATGVLRQEHQVILKVLEVLRRLVERAESGEGFERAAFGECVAFFRLFADACHHGKEEDMLFPVLEQRGIPREGGPIGVMLYEHNVGRQFVREMGAALSALDGGEAGAQQRFKAAAIGFYQLLSNHIHKEDNILFNMSEHVTDERDKAALCGKYCEFGCRKFEGRTREQLETTAQELASRWL